MLRGFEETAVLLSSFQHIKDLCFYFLVCSGLMLWGGTAEEDLRAATVSSSTPSGWPVWHTHFISSVLHCGHFFKPNQATAANSFLGFFLFEYRSQIVDLSFFLYAWTDLITCIQSSLFIQPALCFTLPCFIYGSHVLWLQLQGGDPKAWGSFQLFLRQSLRWIVFILQ